MPRTGDLLARHLTLRERASAVRARVVDGVEAPIEIEERDLPARQLDTLRLARCEICGARDLRELRHVYLLSGPAVDRPPPDRASRAQLRARGRLDTEQRSCEAS